MFILVICHGVMNSAKEDLKFEGLITAEENAGQSESQTAESPPDSPPSQ